MEQKVKALLPTKKLDDNIIKLLDEEVLNRELIEALNQEFARKKLNGKTVPCLFDETKSVEDLTEVEKMTFAEVCFNVLKKQDKSWYEDFNIEKYFSNQDLMFYECYVNKEEIINEMHFKNCIKINDNNYRTNMSGKQVYQYFKNMLILYNKSTQRASKLKKLGTKDKYTRTVSLNKKAVREIADEILNKTFEESEIILNIRLIKGKTPQFKFDAYSIEGVGDITIVPNYDRSSKYCTFCEIIDGYHRASGMIEAVGEHYEKTGKWLDTSIGVKIVLADYDRALRIISQTFKRTDTNKQWLKSLEKNDNGKFVDKVISSSKVLKDNVENTIEECIAFKKETYKSILIDVVDELNIEVNDIAVSTYTSYEMAQKLDELVSIVKMKIKNDKDYQYMLMPNMYILYFKMAYLLTMTGDTIKKYNYILDKLMSLTDLEIKDLKLDKSQFSFNNIFNLIYESEVL